MEDITIKQYNNGCFEVFQGDKSSGELGYDKMLGLVSALTMPNINPAFNGWKPTKNVKTEWYSCNGYKAAYIWRHHKCEIYGCEKPISEFSKSYKHRCKACQAEVMRNKRKEIKKWKINQRNGIWSITGWLLSWCI